MSSPLGSDAVDALVAALESVRRDPDRRPPPPPTDPGADGAGRLLAAVEDLVGQLQDARRRRRDAEDLLDLLTEGVHDAVWDWDLATDTLRQSARWGGMLGFADGEVADTFGAWWEERLHPDDRERVLAARLDFLAGRTEQSEMEYRLRHRDGTYRWIRSRGAARRDPDGRPIRAAGSHTDVTERRRAEAALRESEERFRTLADTAPGLIWLSDADGRRTHVNRGWLEFTGRSPAQELGDGWADGVHPEDLPGYRAAHRTASDARRDVRAELRLRRADGVHRWVLDHAAPCFGPDGAFAGYVGCCIDITERKEAEEAQARLAAIVASTDDAVIGETLDGVITSWNPAAEDMYGHAAHEVVGRSVGLIVPPDRAEEKRAIMARLARGERVRHFETVRVHRDGRRIDVSLSVSPVRDASGRVAGAATIARDVTERARAYQLLEQRVEERTREIERRRRVAASLGDLLRVVNSDRRLEEMLDWIVVQASGLLEADACAIYRRRGPEGALTVQAAHGLDAAELTDGHLAAAEAVIRRSVQRRRSLAVGDLGALPAAPARRGGRRTRAGGGGGPTHALLVAPLIVRDEPYGAFALFRRGTRGFAPETTELVTAFADQAALAIENAQLRGAARQAAALQERQKLARDLHDSVSQALFGIVLGAQTACDILADDASPLAEPLQYVLQLAEAGLAEMRALIFELHPERLHTDGLVGALTKQLEALRSRHGLAIEGVFGAEPDASADVKVAAYRIAQEALQNAVRHARPTRVTVRLIASAEGLRLAVEDDGRGFDPRGAFPGHLGLESMRERAAEAGGHLEIDSAPGRGTRVRAWFPPGSAAPGG